MLELFVVIIFCFKSKCLWLYIASTLHYDAGQYVWPGCDAAEYCKHFRLLARAPRDNSRCSEKNNRVDRASVGLNSKQACVLLRMVADVSSVNPHAVLAARRLLPGAVFLGTDTLDEQETRLRLLIDRHRVHVAAAETWAVVLWKRNAVRAVRIVAELRLLKRISELNSRGVTPNSTMMAEMLVQEWPVHMLQPAIVSWLARLPVELRLRRRWLVKFRRFWNVQYRQLGSRGHLSPGDQRRKVRSKSYHLK